MFERGVAAGPSEAVEVGGAGTARPRLLEKAKNWYARAAVALLNGVLLFFFLNLILYAIIVARSSAKSTPWYWYGSDMILKAYPGWREEDVKTLLSETWRNRGFEYEPFTEFREVPSRGKFVNVEPAGFRFSKDHSPWPPRAQAFNVFVFGGSTTFGYGLPDDQTIPSYLGECGANSSHGRPAVYNFGRASYFSSQELILFQQLLNAGFVPKVAVFIDGLNEFFFPDGQPAFAGSFRRLVAGQAGSNPLDNVPMVRAAHWLSHRWTKPQSSNATYYADRAVLDGIIGRWLANKRMIELMAGGFDVPTIFVWQPVPTYKYDLRYHFLIHSEKAFEANIRSEYGYALMEDLRAQGKLGPNVLWLADMQKDRRENLYVDAIHYKAAFSKEIAEQICGFIAEHPEHLRQ